MFVEHLVCARQCSNIFMLLDLILTTIYVRGKYSDYPNYAEEESGSQVNDIAHGTQSINGDTGNVI